ncbi:MAG: S-layer homology domain-containing protein [Armatimonadetes bacterium]|nr:S-layer homology domain-containing protein [Armatimonadota bacterium]MDW8028436.1 S-layer homology domain-containing protein [Armatimonadota bacterium]
MRKCCLVLAIGGLTNVALGQPLIFKEFPILHGLSEIIYQLHRADIVYGYPDGTFRPKQPAKRQEFAILLYRLADVLVKRFGVKEETLGRKGLRPPVFVDSFFFCWNNGFMIRWLAEKRCFFSAGMLFPSQ